MKASVWRISKKQQKSKILIKIILFFSFLPFRTPRNPRKALTKLVGGEVPQPPVRLAVGHREAVVEPQALRRVAVVDGDEPPALPVRLEGPVVDAPVPALVGGRVRRRVEAAAGGGGGAVLAPVLRQVDHLVEVVDEDGLLLATGLGKRRRR